MPQVTVQLRTGQKEEEVSQHQNQVIYIFITFQKKINELFPEYRN